MNFTKKLDRAVQWAGEKMGSEAKTTMSDEFKTLETEMGLRYDGMERLQKSMTAFVKWIGRRGEVYEDKEKGVPISYLGRTMVSHGEDFEPDSEFGSCLVTLGRADERLAANQEQFAADATAAWLESLERSLAMMKEYQAARKKLENRRLAYDASITKMQKAKRDDFRVEEELRANRAKYEESSEDVLRRMQDIKDAESDSIRDLSGFLDCQLDYHERCAEELRRVKRSWPGAATAATSRAGLGSSYGGGSTGGGRSRSNTARSYNNTVDEEPEPQPVRMPIRSNTHLAVSDASAGGYAPEKPPRPAIIGRSATFQGGAALADRSPGSRSGASTPGSISNAANTAAAAVSSLRSGLRPVSSRTQSGSAYDDDGERRSGSPEYGDRSTSPATSHGSLSRTSSNVAVRKPPPPPPARAKKPPPPPPMRREVGY